MGSLLGDQVGYGTIVDYLERCGHRLVTRHYLEKKPEKLESESPADAELFCKQVYTWISQADFVVFEVSTPCVEVGYDLSVALNKSKPVLVLYKQKTGVVPYGLKGLQVEKLQLASYTDENLAAVLQHGLDWASELADIRFNFPLDATTAEYLAVMAQKKGVSRATYLQQLLKKEMS